jgi:hypothetical protein
VAARGRRGSAKTLCWKCRPYRQVRDRRGHSGRVGWLDQEAGASVLDRVQGAGDLARHDRETVRARFKKGDPESFSTSTGGREPARHREHIGPRVPGVTLGVAHVPGKGHASVESEGALPAVVPAVVLV